MVFRVTKERVPTIQRAMGRTIKVRMSHRSQRRRFLGVGGAATGGAGLDGAGSGARVGSVGVVMVDAEAYRFPAALWSLRFVRRQMASGGASLS